jgi:hypothetical protein
MDISSKPCPAVELITELEAIKGMLPNLLQLDRGGEELGLEVIAAHYKLFAAKSWTFFSKPERGVGFGARMAHSMAARNSRKTFQTMAMYEEKFQAFRSRADGDAADADQHEEMVEAFRAYCDATNAYFRGALGQSAHAAA